MDTYDILEIIRFMSGATGIVLLVLLTCLILYCEVRMRR